ncbi:unnamed protein product [Phytomonas sp. EM1]|nr:unnamed protein product [Phytomonas sp. EM1]|eukprot:CCW65510.1 unnamed protein product [Phytomonas sp. isolate EM1]
MESNLESTDNSKSTMQNEISDSNGHVEDFILPHVVMLKGSDGQITNKTNSFGNRQAHTPQQQGRSVPAESCNTMGSTSATQESPEKGKPITDLKFSSVPMLDDHPTHSVTDHLREFSCEPDMAGSSKSAKEPKHEIEESSLRQEGKDVLDVLGNYTPNSFQHSQRKANKSARPVSRKASETKKDSKCPKKVVATLNTKHKNNDNGVASKKSDPVSSKRPRQNLVNFKTPEVATSGLSRLEVPLVPPKGPEAGGKQTPRYLHRPLASFSDFRAALLGNSILASSCDPTGYSLRSEEGVSVPPTSSPSGAQECRNEDVLLVPSLTTTVSAILAEGVKHKHSIPRHNQGLSLSGTSAICLCDSQGQGSGPTTDSSSSCISQSHTNGRPPTGLAASANPHVADAPQVAMGTSHGVSSVRDLPPIPNHCLRGKHSSLGEAKNDECAFHIDGIDGVTYPSMLPFIRFAQTWVISSRPLSDHPGVVAAQPQQYELQPCSPPTAGLVEGKGVLPLLSPKDVQGMGGGDASSSSGANSVNKRGHALHDVMHSDPSSGVMRMGSGAATVPRPIQFTLLTDRVDTLLPAWCFLTSYLLAPTGDVERAHVEHPPLSHSHLILEKEDDKEGSPTWNPSSLSERTTHLPLKRCFSIYPLAFPQLTPSGVGEGGVSKTSSPTLTCCDRIIDTNSTYSSHPLKVECGEKEKYIYYQVRVRICLNVEDHASLDNSEVHFPTPRDTKVDMMTVSESTDHCTSDTTTNNHLPMLCPIDAELRFSRYQHNQEALQLFAQSKTLSVLYLRAQLNDAALQLIAHAPTASECMMITSQKEIISSMSGKDFTSCQTDLGEAASVQHNTSRENIFETPCESRVNVEVNPASFFHPMPPDLQREEGEIVIKPIGLRVESDVLSREAGLTPLSALTITFTLTACTTASVMVEGCCEGPNAAENHGKEEHGICISKSRLVYRTLVSVFPEAFILSPHTSRVEFGMCSVCKPTLSMPNGSVVASEGDVDFPSLRVKEWKDLSFEELRLHCVLRTNQISLDVTHPHSEFTEASTIESACNLHESSDTEKVEENHQMDVLEPHGEVVVDTEGIKEEENQVDANHSPETNENPTPEVILAEEKCDICPDLSSCNTEPEGNNFSCEYQKYNEVNNTSRGHEVNSPQDAALEIFVQEKSMEAESKEEQMEWDVRDMTAELTEKTQEVCREAEQIDFLIKNYHKLYGIPEQLSDKMNLMFDTPRVPRLGHARRTDPSLTSSTRRGKKSLVDTEAAKREAEFISALVNSFIAPHVALFTAKSIEEEGKSTCEDPDREPHTFFSERYGGNLSSLITVVNTIMWENVTKSVKNTIEGFDDRDKTALLESLFTSLCFSSSSETSFTTSWASHHGEPLLRGLRRDLFSLTDHPILHSASLVDYPTFTSFSGATGDVRLSEGGVTSVASAGALPPRVAVVGEQVLGAKLCKTGRKSKSHTSRAGFASTNDSRTQKPEELLLLPALRVVATAAAGVSGFSSSAHSRLSSQSLERESGLPSTDNIPLVGTFRIIFKFPRALSKAKTKLHEAEKSLERWLAALRDVHASLQWNTVTLLEGSVLPFLSEHMLIMWDGWKGLCDLHTRCIGTHTILNPNTGNTDIFVSDMSCITDLGALTKSIDASEFSSNSSKNVADEFLSSSHAVEHFEMECLHSERKPLGTSLDPESRSVSRESLALLTASQKMSAKQRKKSMETHKQTSNRHLDNNEKTQKNTSVGEDDGVCPPVQERGCLLNEAPVLKAFDSSEKGPINAANVKNTISKMTLRKQGIRKTSKNYKEADVTTRLVLPFIMIGALLMLLLVYI